MSFTTQALMQLLKYSIKPDTELNDDIFTDETLREVYRLSKTHDLAHLVANSITSSGHTKIGRDILMDFDREIDLAMARTALIENEYQMICELFEQKKIAYLPLKGAVIRTMYPQPWMRTSCDLDILVHADDVSAACNALGEKGYHTKSEEYHDVSMFSPSGVHLELHFQITENMNPMDDVLQKVWDYATLETDASFRYVLSSEYQIFHFTAHMAYHFYRGGCGIRPVLDFWILENNLLYNREALNTLLEEAGLLKFYSGAQRLISVWFEDGEPDTLSTYMEDYILRGGVYGNMSNSVALRRTNKKNKTAYLLTRVFPPFSIMKKRYKILKKVPILLPACWVSRLVSLMFSGEKRTKALAELKANKAVSENQIDSRTEMLNELGLADLN